MPSAAGGNCDDDDDGMMFGVGAVFLCSVAGEGRWRWRKLTNGWERWHVASERLNGEGRREIGLLWRTVDGLFYKLSCRKLDGRGRRIDLEALSFLFLCGS